MEQWLPNDLKIGLVKPLILKIYEMINVREKPPAGEGVKNCRLSPNYLG